MDPCRDPGLPQPAHGGLSGYESEFVGGYKNEFVDPPPDELCCFVCALPYREPHLLGCCGKKICEPCIERVRLNAKSSCPFCKQSTTTLLDKELRAKVLDLKVFCLNKSNGCDWRGELRDLENHMIKMKCRFLVVACRYQCGGRFPHRDLAAEHEREECPLRPLELKVESLVRKMEAKFEQYEAKIASLESEIQLKEEAHTTALEAQRVHFEKKVEEYERKLNKMVTSSNEQVGLLREQLEWGLRDVTDVTDRHKQEVVRMVDHKLSDLQSHFYVAPHCELIMSAYYQHKISKDNWNSPPFYTGPGGYKMYLNVRAYGRDNYTGSHVSVLVHLMKGEHDEKLNWPFLGVITIQLVNQRSNENHHEIPITFDQSAEAVKNAHRVFTEGRTKNGWGTIVFISHTAVETPTMTTQYLRNDCLRFRISCVVVHSM